MVLSCLMKIEDRDRIAEIANLNASSRLRGYLDFFFRSFASVSLCLYCKKKAFVLLLYETFK